MSKGGHGIEGGVGGTGGIGYGVGRARVGAETFAEICNGFVEVISWKTMVSFKSLL